MWWWRWSMLELFNMVATSYMCWLRSSNNILSYLILINLKLNTIATYGWWLPYWAVPWDNQLHLLSTYSVPMRVRADAKEMKLFCWGNDLSPALAGGIPNVDMLSGTAQEGQLIFQPSWHWEIWPSEFDVGFRQHGLKTELRQSTLTWKLGHDYQKCCFKQCSKTLNWACVALQTTSNLFGLQWRMLVPLTHGSADELLSFSSCLQAGLQPVARASCSRTCGFLEEALLMADGKEGTRCHARAFKAPARLHALTLHWPKPVTWPTSKSSEAGICTPLTSLGDTVKSHGEGHGRIIGCWEEWRV